MTYKGRRATQRVAGTLLAVMAAAGSVVVLRSTVSDAAPTTYYVAPGATGTSCTSAAPCPTFDAAYQLAVGGDTVEVRAGNYGDQVLGAGTTSSGGFVAKTVTGGNITVRPAAGATVTVTTLTITGPGAKVTGGMTIGNVAFGQLVNGWPYPGTPGANGSSLDGVTVSQGVQSFAGATNVAVRNSHITGANDSDRFTIFGGDGIMIENNVAGAAYRPTGSTNHLDCLQILAGQAITVRGNRLFGCDAETVLVKNDFGAIDNVLFENNFIQDCVVQTTTGEACGAFFAVQFFPGATNVRFYHNSVAGSVGVRAGSGVAMRGNIIRQLEPSNATGTLDPSACATVTIDTNLIGGHRCATLPASNIVGNPTYLGNTTTRPDPATGPDLHLATSSAGVNVGSAYAPPLDIDGQARVAPADLGADETGAAAPTTTTTTTAPPPPPPGIAFITDTGGTNNLPADQVLVDRLKSLGRTVTVIDDNAVGSGGPTGYGLIVVSTRASGAVLGTKLNSSTTPILTWNATYYTTLGLAGTVGTQSSTSRLTVTNTNHPATAGVGTNPVVLNRAATLSYAQPPSSALRLARWANSTNRWALFAVPKGGVLVGRGTAAGCRVAFPAPRNPSDLSASGLRLFDQTSAWALGGCS